jgi:hypothetical protein
LRHWEIDEDPELLAYIARTAADVAASYGDKFDWRRFPLRAYAADHRFMVARRDGVPVGCHLSRLTRSALDPEVTILVQDLLCAASGTRAAKLLLDDFIDFGKAHANHIITMTTPLTRLSQRSLERLGFERLETLYRLEV